MAEPFHEDDIFHTRYPVPMVWKTHYEWVKRDLKDKKGIAMDIKRLDKMFNGKDRAFLSASGIEFLRRFLSKASQKTSNSSNVTDMKASLESYDRLKRMGINNTSALRSALREYLSIRSKVKKEEANPIKEKERALIGRKIEGFFPTPVPVIKDKLLPKADIKPGMTILEPEAGKGDIADVIKEEHPDSNLSTIEIHSDLRNLLKDKGHTVVDHDFLDHKQTYDRIIMNPPFENGQDMEHVQHAYSLLNDDGKLVSVMSSGGFSRNDKQSKAFREWLDSVGGEFEDLPENSFKGKDSFRQTGVSTKVVSISKKKLKKSFKLLLPIMEAG